MDMLCASASGKELSHLFFLSVGTFVAVGGLSCLKIKLGESFVLFRQKKRTSALCCKEYKCSQFSGRIPSFLPSTFYFIFCKGVVGMLAAAATTTKEA